jgi:hypothetical protein
MDELVTWLREQIDADERAVEGACVHIDDCNGSGYGDRFDDARVLAEVEAKRRILDLWSSVDPGPAGAVLAEVILHLAQPLASRPGFRDEWRLT